MTRRARRQVSGVCVIVVIAIALAALRLLIYRNLEGELTLSWPGGEILTLRLNAALVASIAGIALGVSGVLLQALLRNPLASPFILGISSGAALGVMTALYLAAVAGWTWLTFTSNAAPALVGALVVLVVVFTLGQRRGWLDPLSLVLTGVVVSAICGAAIMFLQHLVPHGLRGDLITWMMGHIDQGVEPAALLISGAVALLCVAASAWMGRAMDAATLVEDEARSVGVALGPLRIVMFLLAGALAAMAVTLCGPIGFVGLIAPHAARMLSGPRHTPLVFGAAFMGAALLLAADVASQMVSVGGGRVPVGVFTALIGGPAFIWLLRSGKGQV